MEKYIRPKQMFVNPFSQVFGSDLCAEAINKKKIGVAEKIIGSCFIQF
jgi:hypothetical protein